MNKTTSPGVATRSYLMKMQDHIPRQSPSRKKSKFDTTTSTERSNSSNPFGDMILTKFRLKREADESANEVAKEKDPAMSIICGIPLVGVYCIGCVRWAWKRCHYNAGHDSETWSVATPEEFEPVPRLCRYILAVYEDDLRCPLWEPPGGYGIKQDWLITKRTYEDTVGKIWFCKVRICKLWTLFNICRC
ncbi:lipase, class 3 [Tanacetum coccineum]